MEPRRFDELHAEHDAALRRVSHLEGVLERPDVDPPRLQSAIAAFLRYYDTRLEPHMRLEAAEVYPLLDRYLSPDTPEALRREQQTVRDLAGGLRRRLARTAGDAETEETRIAAQDLAILLRGLITREDRLYHPLLQRLIEGGRRG